MKKVMMIVAAALLSGTASAGYIKWDIANLAGMGYFPAGTGGWDLFATGTLPYTSDFVFALVLQSDLDTAIGLVTANPGSIGDNGNAVFLDWGVNTSVFGLMGGQLTDNLDKISTADTLNYVAMAFVQVGGDWYYTSSISSPSAYKGHPTIPDANEPPALTFGDERFQSPWVLIPEPTAMALLALGAAAVGLRRRFRK